MWRPAGGELPRISRRWRWTRRADIPALHGWRREMFGEDALRLIRGEIALSAQGKRVKIVSV